MYTPIVVALDGSEVAERVVPYARLLGERLSARIELLRVVQPVRIGPEDFPYGMDAEAVNSSMHQEAGEYLANTAMRLTELGLDVSHAVQYGTPAINIVNYAHKEPNGLLAMSARGQSGIARWLLGSVTDKVLHNAKIPLLVRATGPTEGQAL